MEKRLLAGLSSNRAPLLNNALGLDAASVGDVVVLSFLYRRWNDKPKLDCDCREPGSMWLRENDICR